MGIIDGIYQQAESELASTIANDLQTDITKVLIRIQSAKAAIEKASALLQEQSRINNAAKTLRKSVQKQGFTQVKTMQDLITYFDEFTGQGYNRSRILSEAAGGKQKLENYLNLQNASDKLIQQSQEQELKNALLHGYQLIMGIRDALGFKHINYGIIYTGINGSGQQQLLMGTMNVETLISQGRLNKSLSIVLEQTGSQIRNILSGNNQQSMGFENLLARDNGRNAQVWDILTQIQDNLTKQVTSDGKRKYYYFYGQLTEALIDLEGKDLTVESIYEALVQGQNTTSFEKMGDFKLKIAEEELDIQAKTFAAQDTADNEVKTIRITSLSNIMRVLTQLENAFNSGENGIILQNIKQQFTESSKGSKGSLAKAEDDVKRLIKETLDAYLSY